jgi:two-component system sensor histidine kinase QseC
MARDALDFDPLPSRNLPDEVRPLVESFNRLLGRLDRAVQTDRQFLAEAAHELRTPLAGLLTHAQVALRSKSLDEAKASLEQLVRGVERSARLSQQLLDSARLDVERRVGEHAPLELADIVALVTHQFETMATAKHQSIMLDTEPCLIRGNVDDLGILIGNLIDNAARYTGAGGRVAVRCTRERNCVRLQVLDDGPGVALSDRTRIFDRFFRVAGSNERGSGIGLSLVARIAASHDAAIETGSGLEGRGFGITVSFPALQESAGVSGLTPARPDVPALEAIALPPNVTQ